MRYAWQMALNLAIGLSLVGCGKERRNKSAACDHCDYPKAIEVTADAVSGLGLRDAFAVGEATLVAKQAVGGTSYQLAIPVLNVSSAVACDVRATFAVLDGQEQGLAEQDASLVRGDQVDGQGLVRKSCIAPNETAYFWLEPATKQWALNQVASLQITDFKWQSLATASLLPLTLEAMEATDQAGLYSLTFKNASEHGVLISGLYLVWRSDNGDYLWRSQLINGAAEQRQVAAGQSFDMKRYLMTPPAQNKLTLVTAYFDVAQKF